MLHKISAEYAGKAVPLVLDNARYQKCRAVMELAGQLGIELNYVPPYSPNLNLVQHYANNGNTAPAICASTALSSVNNATALPPSSALS